MVTVVIVVQPEVEPKPLALSFGVARRDATAEGACSSPCWTVTATAADVRPPEVARPVRRKGPEVAANRRANLRASRRARRAPVAPAPTLTAFLCHPPCQGVVHTLAEVTALNHYVSSYTSTRAVFAPFSQTFRARASFSSWAVCCLPVFLPSYFFFPFFL